jgi:unspecific monooxygenase
MILPHVYLTASHLSPKQKNLLHKYISLNTYCIASLPKTELSMLSIVVLGFVFWSYLLYKFFIYPAFLSPLAAIPNAHFTSAFSNGWITWQRFRGQPNKAIHDAHTRLGPVLRLGLTEISVNSVEGLNVVYSGNFEKDKFYIPFANYG